MKTLLAVTLMLSSLSTAHAIAPGEDALPGVTVYSDGSDFVCDTEDDARNAVWFALRSELAEAIKTRKVACVTVKPNTPVHGEVVSNDKSTHILAVKFPYKPVRIGYVSALGGWSVEGE